MTWKLRRVRDRRSAEPRKADALMEFPYRPELVHQAGVEFDKAVGLIQAREFTVTTPPERKICKECDRRSYCVAHGTIT